MLLGKVCRLHFVLSVVLLFNCGFVLTSTPAHGQATVSTGSIQGTVLDPQGATVPTAKVSVTAKASGAVITQSIGETGHYSVAGLLPGLYVVRVEATGFKTIEKQLTVQVGIITDGDITLEVGDTSTVVTVEGSSVSVNTDQAIVSGVLTTQQIENLPINGRNFLDLAQLEPGVQIQDGGNFDPTKTGFSSISFGGRFGRTARIQVDGVDISDENVGTTTSGIPASAIQEFQISQSSLDLSTDLTSSGSVNLATRTGSNTLHGEGFGYFRDSSQGAALPAGSSPTPPTYQRNQVGGNIGGAIIKDKLFFFIDGEHTLQHLNAGVPVAAPFDDLSGTFPSPFHETDILGRVDYQVSKNVRAFFRYNFFQNNLVPAFGGAATYSFFANRDHTRVFAGGVDYTQGNFTHSFRGEYLKFINNIADAVRGSNEPFSDLPVSLDFTNSGLATGPSDLAPQTTIQSDRQIKYDGSYVWHSHILRFGVDYNHIAGYSFASFFGISPLVVNFTNGYNTASNVVCPNGDVGQACPLTYYPDEVLLGNGQGSFTELPAFGKSSGGVGPDNRVGIYVGDSWKIKPNLTFTFGVRWDHDTGRTDSDLAPVDALNNVIPGSGARVNQPDHNFSPQAGLAWSPFNNSKTVIRAGAGLYYENMVWNDVLFDRLLRLQNGAFNVYTPACLLGGAPGVPFPGGVQYIGGSQVAGANVCGSGIGDTLGANAGNCAGMTTAACIGAFQTAWQAATAANPTGPNASYVGNLINEGSAIPGGLLAPGYETPRSFQMNIGFQQQLWHGGVLSVDYVRNVGLHFLLGVDQNHSGDVAYFNQTAAATAINSVNAYYGCPGGSAGVACAAGKSPNLLGDYASAGLDSPGDLGVGSCALNTFLPNGTPLNNPCAFGGINQNIGVLTQYEPIGRSVYNAMDIKWVQNVSHPFKGVRYLNFQATYTLSRFVNPGSGGSATAVSGGDQDFINNALNNRDPLMYMGPSSLDRTHQFNFGGYADIPAGFRLGLVGHFWSPLAGTPVVSPNSAGPGVIYNTDFTGDGTIGDPLPGSKVGSFMRSYGPGGLTNAINNYNSTYANNASPAGQTLINSGLLTLSQLQLIGAVAPTIQAPPAGQVGYGWLKATDFSVSWVGKFFHERLTIQPGVTFYNVFNFTNYDSPANTLVGLLSGEPGSINGTTQANRTDKIGSGTGVFALGAPRAIEWGLKATF